MKNKLLITGFLVIAAFVLSLCQILFIYEKYSLFLNEYNRELWENHTGNSAFLYSYVFTFILIAIGLNFFVSKSGVALNVKKVLGIILMATIIISIVASTWLFIMHKKHMIVGYSEWLKHSRNVRVEDIGK